MKRPIAAAVLLAMLSGQAVACGFGEFCAPTSASDAERENSDLRQRVQRLESDARMEEYRQMLGIPTPYSAPYRR